MNLQNSKLKNFTPLPNEIFSLHLTTGELAVYALLLRLENRETHECWPSYETIGKAIGKSKSSVKRYVSGLVEKGLITVEPTAVIMQNGLKKNGNLRYHIRPIREAIEWYTQHQLYLAEAATERQRAQQQLVEQAEEPPCSSLRAVVWPPSGWGSVPAPERVFEPLSGGFAEDFLGSAEDEGRSRIKGWRRYRRSACSHLPAVRTVYGGFRRSRKWRLLSEVLPRLAS